MLHSVPQDEYGFYQDLKQYVLPQQTQNLEAFSGKQVLLPVDTSYEPPCASNDFFASFLNSDFPIDVSFPVQTVPDVDTVPSAKGFPAQRVPNKAPIMQVAQSQNPACYKSKNPTKYNGKRKASARAESSPPSTAASTEEPEPQHGKDEQDTKRQKRRVKNREAAQLFRQRQKQHIRDLEEEVRGINNKNVVLNTQIEVLKAENTMVKEQLRYLRCFITEGLKFAFPENKFLEMDKMLAEYTK